MNDSALNLGAPVLDDGTPSAAALSEHYIEAQTSLVEITPRTLKHGDAFMVLDTHGDIGTSRGSPEGLYFRDTRYLSHYQLRIEGKRPLLLSSIVQDDGAALSIDLTNPDIELHDARQMPRDVIFIERTPFLWERASYERIALRNYDNVPRRFQLDVLFDADFRDLFEIRGNQRRRRGRLTAHVPQPNLAEYRYTGLDLIPRSTRLAFEPTPAKLQPGRATFDITLEPQERRSLFVIVLFEDGEPEQRLAFHRAYRNKRRALRKLTHGIATVASSNDLFNEVCVQATADLYTLATMTPHGIYPYAGIPWYSTVFGRDGIVTALMTLWMDPSIARGVLRYLAATQANHVDPIADAQPGKILHEQRHGEMAMLGEVPFRFYFGSVDATPLFVMLAGAYFDRTGDIETIRGIWPNIKAALDWVDEFGDADGDGFVEYYRAAEKGLVNQGWKDSHDSIFHADGSDATGPIALCEVQAYVFAAKRAAARLAEQFGDAGLADRLFEEAEMLRVRFEERFWCEDIGTYALALDGAKRPCRVRTSNAGHALFTGIASPDHAHRVAATLLDRDSFSGWGIRTLARGEARYNPMSYHNGSVWPHDNAIIALGLSRYGLREKAAVVFEAMFAAASRQDQRRLPELFCGFIRRTRRGPTAYPVACSPQAWAAAAPFAFLQACLGFDLAYTHNEVRFTDPCVPEFLNDVTLQGLRLGGSRLDLRLNRHGADVTINVLAREGDARVVLQR
jgi:glycogen debranching enzyme